MTDPRTAKMFFYCHNCRKDKPMAERAKAKPGKCAGCVEKIKDHTIKPARRAGIEKANRENYASGEAGEYFASLDERKDFE